MRIKQVLDLPHEVEGVAVLGRHESDLAEADAMFAGGGTAQIDRFLYHAGIQLGCDLVFDIIAEGENHMDIAIAGVPQQIDGQG